MKLTTRKSSIRCIRKNDHNFMIQDGLTMTPRAGFEIDHSHCPKEYQAILRECMTNGWIKPVAYMTEKEFVFSGISNSK